MYQPPISCSLVAGTINPGGWCEHYEADNRKMAILGLTP
jgi:hypothetical protein